ncbi:MAG: SOS response-associated peptidase [Firmicutes bacterium]|nr:SOS response-associated peptidase [Bacillota bacterium]
MCGRYSLNYGIENLLKRYRIRKIDFDFTVMKEIFPSNKVPIIINREKKEIRKMKWGFSPSFTKRLIINARAETVNEKRLFKNSFIRRRCLIPASSFFEWEKVNGNSYKYKIEIKNKNIFSMAGIYDFYKDKNGDEIEAFTILTTNANNKMKKIHRRMPVILNESDEKIWLKEIENYNKLKELVNKNDNNDLIFKKI